MRFVLLLYSVSVSVALYSLGDQLKHWIKTLHGRCRWLHHHGTSLSSDNCDVSCEKSSSQKCGNEQWLKLEPRGDDFMFLYTETLRHHRGKFICISHFQQLGHSKCFTSNMKGIRKMKWHYNTIIEERQWKHEYE